jgi:8-oxo-dGTP diphosphatase
MSQQKEQYVRGFLFDQTKQHVVLLKRNKPPVQAGKYNGVGGKVEPNETPMQAMQREFEEEAGLPITDWTPFAEVSGSTWVSYFFHASDVRAHQARTMEEQEVQCFP